MPYENREFKPTTERACEKEIRRLIGIGYVTDKTLKHIAQSVFNDRPIHIQIAKDWAWMTFHGERFASEDDLQKELMKAGRKAIRRHLKIKNKWGKAFF